MAINSLSDLQVFCQQLLSDALINNNGVETSLKAILSQVT